MLDTQKQSNAIRLRHRHHVRRVKSERYLAEIIPYRIETGDSWHVLSSGDIDSLSYLQHLITGYGYFDDAIITSWCIGPKDVIYLKTLLDQSKLERLKVVVGEYFPSRSPDEHDQLLQLKSEPYNVDYVVNRCHCKIFLLHQHSTDTRLVVESSANVNTNPRIEQTVIHNNPDLYAFYHEHLAPLRNHKAKL